VTIILTKRLLVHTHEAERVIQIRFKTINGKFKTRLGVQKMPVPIRSRHSPTPCSTQKGQVYCQTLATLEPSTDMGHPASVVLPDSSKHRMLQTGTSLQDYFDYVHACERVCRADSTKLPTARQKAAAKQSTRQAK
jgi:hypothetical protein